MLIGRVDRSAAQSEPTVFPSILDQDLASNPGGLGLTGGDQSGISPLARIFLELLQALQQQQRMASPGQQHGPGRGRQSSPMGSPGNPGGNPQAMIPNPLGFDPGSTAAIPADSTGPMNPAMSTAAPAGNLMAPAVQPDTAGAAGNAVPSPMSQAGSPAAPAPAAAPVDRAQQAVDDAELMQKLQDMANSTQNAANQFNLGIPDINTNAAGDAEIARLAAQAQSLLAPDPAITPRGMGGGEAAPMAAPPIAAGPAGGGDGGGGGGE